MGQKCDFGAKMGGFCPCLFGSVVSLYQGFGFLSLPAGSGQGPHWALLTSAQFKCFAPMNVF